MGPDIPNYADLMVAWTGVGTLVAAVAAGFFAWRAAHWTKKQASSTSEQVEVAKDELKVARADAKLAREQADHSKLEALAAARHLAESRVDAEMPSVLAVAMPGFVKESQRRPFLEIGGLDTEGNWVGRELTERVEATDVEFLSFRVNVMIELKNVSDRIALVDVTDKSGGEVRPSSSPIILSPGQNQLLRWDRVVPGGALSNDRNVGWPSTMGAVLWVRDYARNAYDELRFNADIRFFSRDGSRLIVSPEPAYPWVLNLGQRMPIRVYERLDAQEQSSGQPKATTASEKGST